MIQDLDDILSVNIKHMKRSAIRELLKLISRPEIISFAGGLPSPESFAVEELKEVIMSVMDKEAALALQYGATEGDTLLRELLVQRYRKLGMDITIDNLIITTASQQALDLIAKMFLNRGDKIIVELPSYLGGLSAFNSYGGEAIGIPMDDHGMRSDLLEAKLAELKKQGIKPKFIYIIPDFQNPAGVTMSEDRRKEIIKIAHKYDILILEDSPYRELRYEGKHQRTLYELDGTGQVIMLCTFSKIFVPGFRIGWVIAHPDILDKIVLGKQATDLCTPAFNQRIAARYIEKGYLDSKIQSIINQYRDKKKVMLDSLEEFMPKGVSWTKPEGGLFLQVTCPESINTNDLLLKAIDQEFVAFVAGSSFYCDGSGLNTMRLNFSYMPADKTHEGIKRLGKVIANELK
ncbi:MAG TPA: PLP-dependent aminotransferase family protein [Candidatus Cloacimonadota bacterium]|nr:PLP-dependent aminotransferase family protein [Candidatus Cloacimonadota bacterium]